jgi:hypothetical protein
LMNPSKYSPNKIDASLAIPLNFYYKFTNY